MNTEHENAEIASMVKERREVKSRLLCTQNKIKRFCTTLERTVFWMKVFVDTPGFRFFPETDEFSVLSVPGVQGYEKDLPFPTRDEIANTIKDRDYLESRLAELNNLLD